MCSPAPYFPFNEIPSHLLLSEKDSSNVEILDSNNVETMISADENKSLEDTSAWWVWKFGGSSVGNYERMLQVTNLICDQLKQWDSVDGKAPCLSHVKHSKSLPFLPSTLSPSISRKMSQTTPLLSTNGGTIAVSKDHLAVVSSAIGGVTNLLSSCLHKAASVMVGESSRHSQCRKLELCTEEADKMKGVEDTSHRKGLQFDENLGRIHQVKVDRTRLPFVLEAKAELRQWGSEGSLLAEQLNKCQFSHIYGAPIKQLIQIHMDVVESAQKVVKRGLTGLTNMEMKKHFLDLEKFKRTFFTDVTDIVCVLHTVSLTGSITEPLEAYVLGMGEIWAVRLLKIILAHKLQTHKPEVVILVLNAREVLTLRRMAQLPKHCRVQMLRERSPFRSGHPSTLEKLGSQISPKGNTENDSFSANDKRDDALEYNPSRRTLSTLAGRRRSPVATMACSTTHRRQGDLTIEYSIGSELGPVSLSGCSRDADVSPNDEEDVSSCWAFPSWNSLPPTTYPPAGPLCISRSDANTNTLPTLDWHASYTNFARWFYVNSSKKQRKASQRTLNVLLGSRETSSSEASIKPVRYVMLVTGFICKTLDDFPATLQRNGSDTSAVALASLLRAQGVTIWSDVAGVFTADPRQVSNAEPLDYLTYEEALELAGIGAKILHPASLLPCMHMQIPMLLKSSYIPECKGTLIANFSHLQDEATLGKVVSNLSDVALLTLSNYPLTSVYRFASRFFNSVERGGGKLLFISQGASSSAISVAVSESEVNGVLYAVQEEFGHDAQDFGSHLKVTVDPSCSVLSVVGRGQTGYVGALASWCTALKENRISIKAISQSSNEMSTSFVVCKFQEKEALHALHSVVISTRNLSCG